MLVCKTRTGKNRDFVYEIYFEDEKRRSMADILDHPFIKNLTQEQRVPLGEFITGVVKYIKASEQIIRDHEQRIKVLEMEL
jgi:hypothetical protein